MRNEMALAAVAILLSASCFALTDNRWQADASGNWSGKWSDTAHWSQGRTPNGSTDDTAIFDNQAVPYTVEIDGDYTVPGFFKIGEGKARPGTGMVTFTGTGSVRQSQSTFYVYTDREFCVEGNVSIGESNSMEAMSGSKTYVAGNGAILLSGQIKFNDAAEIHIRENGRMQGYFTVADSCTSGAFTMSGGSFKSPRALPAFPEAFEIAVTGGRLSIVGNCSDYRFLPKGDAVFEQIGSGLGTFQIDTPFTNELSGTYIGTNSSANSGFRFDAFADIYGGGNLIADAYIPNASSVTSIVDVANLGIGNRFHLIAGVAVLHPGDMTISAHGDYYNPAGSYVSSAAGAAIFAGQVTFDTLDAFDRTTTRMVSLTGVSETPGFGFRVTGGGSQTLYWKDLDPMMPAIRNVSVDAGTSLAFHDSSAAKGVRTDFLKLGENASLSYKASVNTIDAAESDVAANASVTVNMSGLSAADNTGTRARPVFMASSGDAPALSQFTFNNLSGWVMKKVDGIVYAKSTTAETSTNPSSWRWTGANSSDWSVGGNWAGNGASGPGADDIVYFTLVDSGRNEINIPVGGATIKRIVGGGKNNDANAWYRNAEPYLFQGGDLTVSGTGSGNQESSIFTCSQCPLLFDCKVVGTTLGVLGYSFVAFRGGLTANELKMVSEVRIGGNAAIGKVTSAADHFASGDRYTTLTVLKGGNLTTSQSSSNNKHLGLRVLGGGTATFAQTVSYSSATLPTSYQVDGRLNFTGTLNLSVPITLTGTGRVDVAGNSTGSEDGRITMKGGVTLSPVVWSTASASNGGMMPLSVAMAQSATLAPRGNVVYGPSSGVSPTTTAADRALRLGRRSTLMVATGDLDDSAVSHDISFVDPIEAETMAQIVKTGAGKMTLAASANVFADKSGIDVRDGTLAWAAAQSLGSLAFSAGTAFEPIPSGGSFPVLTVRSNVNLDGVRISIPAILPAGDAGYHTIVAVPAGCVIAGTPVVADNVKMRIVEDGGGFALQIRNVPGFRIILK